MHILSILFICMFYQASLARHINVWNDAAYTYDGSRGLRCSGPITRKPIGKACPKKKDRSIGNCFPWFHTYHAESNSCIAVHDASCVKRIETGQWECQFPNQTYTSTPLRHACNETIDLPIAPEVLVPTEASDEEASESIASPESIDQDVPSIQQTKPIATTKPSPEIDPSTIHLPSTEASSKPKATITTKPRTTEESAKPKATIAAKPKIVKPKATKKPKKKLVMKHPTCTQTVYNADCLGELTARMGSKIDPNSNCHGQFPVSVGFGLNFIGCVKCPDNKPYSQDTSRSCPLQCGDKPACTSTRGFNLTPKQIVCVMAGGSAMSCV